MAPLIPIAVSVLPSIIELLAGDKAGRVAGSVADAVRQVTGATDRDGAMAAIADPVKAAELRTRLAEIALDAKRAELADTANARAMTGQSPLVARAQVVGGAVVLATWVAMVVKFAFGGMPYGHEALFTTIFAGVSAMLGSIHQFFYGNSTAAHAANNRLDKLAEFVGTGGSQPSAIATTAPVTVNNPPSTDDLNAASLARARSSDLRHG